MINLIVFSKDRAMQLDLFIRSFLKNYKVDSNPTLNILYTCSNDMYLLGYTKLINKYKEISSIKFIKQSECFKSDVISLIDRDKKFIQFFCDDDIIIKEYNLFNSNEFDLFCNDEKIFCIALRLGFNIEFCYTENRLVQAPNKNVFEWKGLLGDWGYPLSVDGNIFRTEDIYSLITGLIYRSPNTFEGQLANKSKDFYETKPYMICFDRSLLFNVPANKVQIDCNNRAGNISASELNDKLINGYEIDLKTLENIIPKACHQEVEFIYKKESGN